MLSSSDITCLLVGLLVSCTAPGSSEQCGERPLFPGFTVAIENGKAIMSSADFARIEAWRADFESYATCLEQALTGIEDQPRENVLKTME